MSEDKPEQPDDAEEKAADAAGNGTAQKTGEDDPWAEARAEQATRAQSQAGAETRDKLDPSAAVSGGDTVFKPIDHESGPGTARDLDLIMNIPVRLHVELGRTRIPIKKLLELTQGSLLELDGLAGDPMDILVNGYLIAQGEVVVVEDKYGIRITNIITPSERVKKLNT